MTRLLGLPARVLGAVVCVAAMAGLSVVPAWGSPRVASPALTSGPAPATSSAPTSPDTFVYPTNGASAVDTTQAFRWSSGAGSQGSILVVGTKQYGANLVNSGVLPATQTTFNVPALPVGETLYATLLTKEAGAWSQFQAITFTAAPGADWFTSPRNGQAAVDTNKSFTWSSIPASQGSILVVGTTPYGADLVNSGVLPASQTSYTVPVLPSGKTLYATLLTETNGGWTRFQAVTFTAAATIAHGAPERSFGDGGAIAVDTTSGSPTGLSMVASTGQTLVAFLASVASGGTQGYVARLTPTGQLDPTFGTGGVATLPTGLRPSEALDAGGGGNVLVVGTPPGTGGNAATELVRLLPNGTLDTTFGTGGAVTLPGRMDAGPPPQAVISASGEIFVGMSLTTGPSTDELAVYALSPTGAVDTSFGSSGRALTGLGGSTSGPSLALQPNGDVVAAGSVFLAGANSTVVARFLPSGQADTSFADNGVYLAQLGGSNGGPMQVAIDASGNLVLGGSAFTANGQVGVVARLTGAGSLDASFGNGGVVIKHPTGDVDDFVALNLGTNGDIYGLMMQSDGPFNGSLYRFTASGGPDTTFGTGGSVALSGLIPTSMTLSPQGSPEVGIEAPPTAASLVLGITS